MQRIIENTKFIYKSLSRKISPGSYTGPLVKQLNMFDVTLLSIGNTIGVGPFLFIGRYTTGIGPALLITNIFTFGIILMSALCYAEFIKKENTSGGAYRSAYQLMGEWYAAVLGCVLSIQHIFGASLAARGLSKMIDELTENKISDTIKSYMSFSSPLLGSHPDVIGFVIPIISAAFVSFKVKTVTNINNICCLINLGLYVLITLVTGSNLNFENWSLPPSEKCGEGGFFPYGKEIIFQGVARVYTSYIGFDAAGHAGSEVRDPERIIPLSIILAVIMLGVLYTLNSFTYTLVWPYCDQDLDDPIPDIMTNIGMDIMKWITAIGMPIGMLGKFICNTYPLSRLIYAMAEDGLLYPFLARVNDKTKTPIYALYSSATLTAICALLFDLIQLAQLTCLGAMAAYTLISYSLLNLNYSDEEMEYGSTDRSIYKIIMNQEHPARIPTIISSSIVHICCWIIFLTSFPFLLTLRMGYYNLINGKPIELIIFVSFFLFYLTILIVIHRQPLSKKRHPKFRIVPVLPVSVILINTYLCMEYSLFTWIHLSIWLLIGSFVYLTYGVWNTKARKRQTFDIINFPDCIDFASSSSTRKHF